MIIAIASGKGGTGKTTVSANLARSLEDQVQLLDCDVEEPNCHLFIQGKKTGEEVVSIKIPCVDESKCNGCGECSRFCEFSAIVSFGTAPLIFPEMCHGCGGCIRVCPQNAITEVDKKMGVLETFTSGNITLTQGKLDVGVAMAPPLIKKLKLSINQQGVSILDAPPGTSCPVIATLTEVDYTVLVTEPTPFGLNDLKLAVDMIRVLKVPFGVVINRVGVGDDRVHQYCKEEKIPVLLEIPNDRRIAEAYSKGILMIDALPEYKSLFKNLYATIKGSLVHQ
jgi:MinD superfamily P-loop ATPase